MGDALHAQCELLQTKSLRLTSEQRGHHLWKIMEMLRAGCIKLTLPCFSTLPLTHSPFEIETWRGPGCIMSPNAQAELEEAACSVVKAMSSEWSRPMRGRFSSMTPASLDAVPSGIMLLFAFQAEEAKVFLEGLL